MQKKILITLPNNDFDTTEVAVPWKLFTQKKYEITFATPNGKRAYCDPKLLTGVIFGQLGAEKEAIKFYNELEQNEIFLNPIKYSDIIVTQYDLLVLPGGHAQGMKPYLESKILQEKVLQFFELNKLVGSICHGCIVLARTINPSSGKSVIHHKKITGLTKFLERIAYFLTFWKLGKYYRTYPAYVQDEVKRNLVDAQNFNTGGNQFKPYVCVDENLVTARWPKDAYLFAETLINKLEK
ncbi:MAG: type 1 glutamine amidotransferase domain-containing protein [Ferruginibacter sp.]